MKTHTEDAFERLIVEHLVLHGGYEPRGLTAFDPDEALAIHAGFDAQRALIPADVLGFVADTQPKPWARLQAIHGASLADIFIEALAKALDTFGMLSVLRRGFKFHGQKILLAYFKPGNNLNPAVWDLYDQNRLRVLRQLRYDPKTDDELDLALFVNGLPIATGELKNAMTGQQATAAKQQYRQDRDPHAPLFRFKARALVHFALDADEVWMTTHLNGPSTRFPPFNRGHDGGAGNPPVAGRHRTCYLWEEVWQRDDLLDLVGRFLHLQTEEEKDADTGQITVKETMVFPRYHQWDCVRRLLAAARETGAGTNFLSQHSAGSGKSNTIAWVAHRLASLHDDQERKVYDAVVVLTDRKVLDQQLQNTVYQFEHKSGVVEKIDTDSAQLARALTAGVPIIISTIHKFEHKTLELFGHRGPDGRPAPFHLYSMRQAIEEGFILDVLKGYMTYQRFFQLAKQVADDPVLDKKKAAVALARFVSLHPTNIAQMTQIILEHFRACVMHQLQGRAKAMLVTSSRLMAVKYKQSCDA